MTWKVADRPGYFGTDRDRICAEYDRQFGEGNWRISWQWKNGVIQRAEALLIYQRG